MHSATLTTATLAARPSRLPRWTAAAAGRLAPARLSRRRGLQTRLRVLSSVGTDGVCHRRIRSARSTPEAIVTALTNGKMAVQGAALSPAEHRAVAQFLTGRAPSQPPRPAHLANRCTGATPTTDPTRSPGWTTWGGDATNGRNVPKGGITAADLPKLKLKWAFAYERFDSRRACSRRSPAASCSSPATTPSCRRSTRRPAAPTGPTGRSPGSAAP